MSMTRIHVIKMLAMAVAVATNVPDGMKASSVALWLWAADLNGWEWVTYPSLNLCVWVYFTELV